MPTASPGCRIVQVAVRDRIHADLRREAFEQDTSISDILRRLVDDHLANRASADELQQAFDAGRRAERERIIAALQRPANGLPRHPPTAV